MAVEYNSIDNAERLAVADILSKREAINGELEAIQNERAAAEVKWAEKEQALKAEKNKLTGEVRNIRKATVTIEAIKNTLLNHKV